MMIKKYLNIFATKKKEHQQIYQTYVSVMSIMMHSMNRRHSVPGTTILSLPPSPTTTQNLLKAECVLIVQGWLLLHHS